MKLSKLYTNFPDKFEPIEFNDGFNVVIGEIRIEKNKNQDSHNLGKSKLADVIDFCLLKKRTKTDFLFKHFELFEKFTFYIEVKLNSGDFLTIRRSVKENSKISFIKHNVRFQDYSNLSDDGWTYLKIPFAKAKVFLDSLLNLSSIGEWNYRNALGYSLRKQEDFTDVFKLDKFRGNHIQWKPFLGHILGFNALQLTKNYELKSLLDKLNDEIKELETQLGLKASDDEALHDALANNKSKAERIQKQLDSFDFSESDSRLVEEISSEFDEELEELNRTRYYLKSNIRELNKSLSSAPSNFNIKTTQLLFEQAGVLFGEQISKTYEQLVDFNNKITVERSKYVEKQILELEEQLTDVVESIDNLHKEKSLKAASLQQSDLFEKFKSLSRDLILINIEINEINRKLELANLIKDKNKEHRKLSDDKQDIFDAILLDRESVTQSESNVYKKIKDNFSNFVETVLSKTGSIKTIQNEEGNLDFFAGFYNNSFEFTSESDGHSYKKILCIAYDLAVCTAYQDKSYMRFLYHDGALETLDNRKKINFLNYIRSECETSNNQYIITVIDSDIPRGFSFDDSEIILNLHDEGTDGLLFKMPPW